MVSALLRPRDGPVTDVAARPRAVAVRRLALTDVRSYRHARLELDGRPVVLVGANGAGKTNLLEAVSLLAPGRGLRGAKLGEIDRHGGGSFTISARIDPGDGRMVDVGTGGRAESDHERRVVRIDGADASQTALAEAMRVIWLTPAMDQLFQDTPAARRRFMDRLVLVDEPAHAAAAARYQQAVRERLRLLRTGRADPTWLDLLETRAGAAGVAVAAARRATVGRLNAALSGADHGETRGAFPRARLALDGTVEAWLEDMPALAVEARFADTLRAERGRDGESGMTATGPHRSDLLVSDAGSGQPARLCSTGEQKALLISIVLAEAKLRASEGGRLPVLLLDEVAAHLDAGRRRTLFDLIRELRAQTWLTGTDATVFQPLAGDVQAFTLDASILRPLGLAP
jgi:DNA replication and repair protein RecF